MDDSAARTNLHAYLKHERAAVLAKLDGLSEYDVRRPMTTTGTNLREELDGAVGTDTETREPQTFAAR